MIRVEKGARAGCQGKENRSMVRNVSDVGKNSEKKDAVKIAKNKTEGPKGWCTRPKDFWNGDGEEVESREGQTTSSELKRSVPVEESGGKVKRGGSGGGKNRMHDGRTIRRGGEARRGSGGSIGAGRGENRED